MIIDELSKLITSVAQSLGYTESLRVIKSNRPELCDYQCDDVFKLVKLYHKSPMEIGNEIVNGINSLENFEGYFDRVEFCNPGFINLTLSNEFINKSLIKMNNNDKFNLPKLNVVNT